MNWGWTRNWKTRNPHVRDPQPALLARNPHFSIIPWKIDLWAVLTSCIKRLNDRLNNGYKNGYMAVKRLNEKGLNDRL